jgi:hypothetical protein
MNINMEASSLFASNDSSQPYRRVADGSVRVFQQQHELIVSESMTNTLRSETQWQHGWSCQLPSQQVQVPCHLSNKGPVAAQGPAKAGCHRFVLLQGS